MSSSYMYIIESYEGQKSRAKKITCLIIYGYVRLVFKCEQNVIKINFPCWIYYFIIIYQYYATSLLLFQHIHIYWYISYMLHLKKRLNYWLFSVLFNNFIFFARLWQMQKLIMRYRIGKFIKQIRNVKSLFALFPTSINLNFYIIIRVEKEGKGPCTSLFDWLWLLWW